MDDFGSFLDHGFAAMPPSAVEHIAAAVRDHCYAIGDVRYCIAAECLDIISSCWGDDGAVRQSVTEEIEAFVMGELAAAMAEPDPEAARSLALGARTSLIALIGASGDLVYGWGAPRR